MRIAHIIIAHKNPDQLSRLIKSLAHPMCDVYLHIDAKVSLDPFLILNNHKNLVFIKHRSNCNWGGYSLFKGILSCVEEILGTGIKYDFINLLSGQDYPLRSADYIYEYFNNRIGKIFLSFDDSKELNWWKNATNRFEKYHFTDFNFPGRYLVQRLINSLLPIRKFPLNISLYGGNKACWWTISSQSANYIIQELQKNTRLNNFLKFCWGIDEFVIPTMIMNSPFKGEVINDNLRYIDWSEGNANPKILTNDDFSVLMNSGMLFARKFDLNIDYSIVDRIDETIVVDTPNL